MILHTINLCCRPRCDIVCSYNSLTPPLFIEESVPRPESHRSCICVLEVMYLCVRGVDFASFYDFDILFWHTSDSVFISLYKKALKHTCKPIDVMNKCSRSKRCTTTITLCMRNSDMLMFILVSLLTVCTLDCFYIAWHILSS